LTFPRTSPEEFLARLEEAHEKQTKRSPSPEGRECSSTASTQSKASLQANFSQAKTKVSVFNICIKQIIYLSLTVNEHRA
jgi:hypothetical protein